MAFRFLEIKVNYVHNNKSDSYYLDLNKTDDILAIRTDWTNTIIDVECVDGGNGPYTVKLYKNPSTVIKQVNGNWPIDGDYVASLELTSSEAMSLTDGNLPNHEAYIQVQHAGNTITYPFIVKRVPMVSPSPSWVDNDNIKYNVYDILNLFWRKLYESGETFVLYYSHSNPINWQPVYYLSTNQQIKTKNYNNLPIKPAQTNLASLSDSTTVLFKLVKENLDENHGYSIVFGKFTRSNNVMLDIDRGGEYRELFQPTARYHFGTRIGIEKAITLDEAIPLGQLEFDGIIGARIRNFDGQLPDWNGDIIPNQPIDRKKAFNIVIGVRPEQSYLLHYYQKTINFDDPTQSQPITLSNFCHLDWGVYKRIIINVSDIIGNPADPTLKSIWTETPFINGKYHVVYKPIYRTIPNVQHKVGVMVYDLVYYPNDAGTQLIFESVSKKDAMLANALEIRQLCPPEVVDNCWNVVIMRLS